MKAAAIASSLAALISAAQPVPHPDVPGIEVRRVGSRAWRVDLGERQLAFGVACGRELRFTDATRGVVSIRDARLPECDERSVDLEALTLDAGHLRARFRWSRGKGQVEIAMPLDAETGSHRDDRAEAVPLGFGCGRDGHCNDVALMGFSERGRLGYVVPALHATGEPGFWPSEFGHAVVVDLVADRVLVDKVFSEDELERQMVWTHELWPARVVPPVAGTRAYREEGGEPWPIRIEGDIVVLERPAGGGRKVLGRVPRGSGTSDVPAVIGWVKSPFERRLAVLVRSGPAGRLFVFGAQLDRGFESPTGGAR